MRLSNSSGTGLLSCVLVLLPVWCKPSKMAVCARPQHACTPTLEFSDKPKAGRSAALGCSSSGSAPPFLPFSSFMLLLDRGVQDSSMYPMHLSLQKML